MCQNRHEESSMGNTRQVISKTLILPAIGSFQYIASVDPGLRSANGTVLIPYINTPDKDLSFAINGDGTIDIYNVSGRNLSGGKRIVVSAMEQIFNNPTDGTQVVTTPPSTPSTTPVLSIPTLWATSTDNQTFADTPVIINFDSGANSALIAQGYVADPGANTGRFLILKPGVYSFSGSAIFCATGGGPGNIKVQMYINGVAQVGAEYRQAVDFGAGNTDRSVQFSYVASVSQALIDSGGGARTYDWRISSNAGGVTGKTGTAVSNTTQSCNVLVSYTSPDYFTAAP